MIKKDKNIKAADISKCAVAVVLMAVSAYVKIPFPFMPLTFQTAVCVLTLLLLGSRYGVFSMACYLVLGLIGIPVFSKGGGLWYISELSFGYIIGYVISAFAVWALVRKQGVLSFKRAVVISVIIVFIIYLLGIIYFCIIWTFILKSAGLSAAVFTYNLVFLPKDIILCFPTAYIATRVSGRIKA